jgi:hypothetical protein
MRNLTPVEQLRILESCKVCKEPVNIHEDFAVRYISNGYEYFQAVNSTTLNSIFFPSDSHICNVIGNMNYTEAYRILENKNN